MNREDSRSVAGRRQELIGILPNIRRFALSLTGSMADADDLLQSTVERLLERLPGPRWPDDAPLLPYCLKACRNLWIDELRSRKVRQSASQFEHGALSAEQSVCGEQQALGEMSLQEAQAVLAEMPAEQRAVLELVAVEGYSYREAADLLDIPVGTVMSRLARGRATVIERLKN